MHFTLMQNQVLVGFSGAVNNIPTCKAHKVTVIRDE